MDYNEYERNKDVTYRINSHDDIKKILDTSVSIGQGPVYIVIETQLQNYDKTLLYDVSQLTQKFIGLGYIPRVSFNLQDLNIEEKELENVLDFWYQLNKIGGDVVFNESLGDEYSLEEVIDAWASVQGFIDSVKSTKASPFEMFIMTQNYVASRVYCEDDNKPENARDLIKVLNGTKIVCVGYASIMEYILNRLGINCVSQPCYVCDKEGRALGAHLNNIVFIEDEKYAISGLYYLDVCWDSIKEREEPFLKYAYSLIPVNDVKHMKTREIKTTGGFFDALYSKEGQDDLYNELIESHLAAESVAYDMGIEREFDALYEYLDGDDEEIVNRRRCACEKMLQILKQENISFDFFDADDIPCESSLPMFLANLMQKEVDESLLKVSIESIRKYKELKRLESINLVEYIKAPKGVKDVYKYLEQFKSGTLDVEDDECLFQIEEKLRCLRFAKYVDEIIDKAKTVKPISLSAYKKAIIESNVCLGADRAFAKKQAERAIDKTVKLAEQIYDSKAKNCFTQEALKRRQENLK